MPGGEVKPECFTTFRFYGLISPLFTTIEKPPILVLLWSVRDSWGLRVRRRFSDCCCDLVLFLKSVLGFVSPNCLQSRSPPPPAPALPRARLA